MPERPPETLYDDDFLRIRFEAADSDEAIVSFSGIGIEEYEVPQNKTGRRVGTQIDEFRGTLGGLRNVYYVVDKERSWFNNALDSQILHVLNDHIAASRFRRVTTIGNSMGGTGALMFASRLLRCRQAIAFAPQSSVHPDIAPFETRWKKYRRNISAWTAPDPITAMDDERRYYAFYGVDDAQDEQHIQRIIARASRKLAVFAIEACGHDVTQHLKNRGVFQHLIIRANSGGMTDIKNVLKGVPHRITRQFEADI